MGMCYPYRIAGVSQHWLSASAVVYIHTGVGFGVARFDNQAMPEPLNVGRVTDRLPRFFFVYQQNP